MSDTDKLAQAAYADADAAEDVPAAEAIIAAALRSCAAEIEAERDDWKNRASDAEKAARMAIATIHERAAERDGALADRDRLREALKCVDHTLTVHGKVDADTDLHAFVRAALSSPTPEGGGG